MNGFQYKHGDRPLEGYTIQRALGRGGFGEVYFALSDSGREVALKAIQGYEQIELRGVSQCMNLKSPHLVTIFDVRHNDDGKPFVIMEYVAGPSLKDLVDQTPSGLGPQKSAFFLREMAKGLTFLHDRGIVHRDLKPGNVFYEDGYVKIGDYGLSKAMSASRYSGQTITVGTVHYMAPEIGQGRYDSGVDIYALGCCLYEMLTGSVPFFGSSHGEILMKHLMAEPDLTGIEEPFATAIRKALAKDPKDRFQSAQEMVESVFGAEHIRDSVSCFTPESLTLVAGRVAQKVAVGGPGSSADAHRLAGEAYGPAAPPLPPLPRGGQGGVPGGYAGSPPLDKGGPGGVNDPWQNIAQSMDRFGQRMGQFGERLGDRMRNFGDRIAGRAPLPPQPAAPAAEQNAGELLGSSTVAFADPKRDPLGRRHRLLLGLITVGATGVLGAIAGADSFRGSESAFSAWVLSTFITLGAVIGINLAHLFRGRMRHESGFIPHLTFGGLACFVALPLFGLCMAGVPDRNGERFLLICGMIAIALLVVDWRERTAPGRKERVSLGSAFSAGLFVWVLGFFMGGPSLLAAAVLAGISLAVQVSAPFDPLGQRHPKRKLKGQWFGAQNEFPAPPYAPGYPAGAAYGADAALGANAPYAAAGSPPLTKGGPGGVYGPAPMPTSLNYARRSANGLYLTPGWLRGIFLGLFIIAAGTGILLLIMCGITRLGPEEFTAALSAGIGCLVLALLSLIRAVRKQYRAVWSAFIRPLLMFFFAQSIFSASVFIGNARNLHDDELLVALIFIIFPALFFILLFFITDRTIHGLLPGLPAAGAAPQVPPNQVSERKWWVALILACTGFFTFVHGLHRFYSGKVGTGILWLLTGGLLGIGTIVDILYIVNGLFRDREGRVLITSTPSPAGFPAVVPAPAPGYAAPMPPAADGFQGPLPPLTRGGQGGVNDSPAVPFPPANLDPVPPDLSMPPEPAPMPPPWSSFAPAQPPAPRKLTGRLGSTLGGILIVAAFFLGLATIVFPSLIAAGFPSPSAAAELDRIFGYQHDPAMTYSGWPSLMARLGTTLAVGLMVLGVIAMVMARGPAGPLHAFRAVLGAAGLGLCLICLNSSLAYVSWPEVLAQTRSNHVGPAIELILNHMDGPPLIFAAAFLLSGIFLMSWPERRRPSQIEIPADQGRLS